MNAKRIHPSKVTGMEFDEYCFLTGEPLQHPTIGEHLKYMNCSENDGEPFRLTRTREGIELANRVNQDAIRQSVRLPPLDVPSVPASEFHELPEPDSDRGDLPVLVVIGASWLLVELGVACGILLAKGLG